MSFSDSSMRWVCGVSEWLRNNGSEHRNWAGMDLGTGTGTGMVLALEWNGTVILPYFIYLRLSGACLFFLGPSETCLTHLRLFCTCLTDLGLSCTCDLYVRLSGVCFIYQPPALPQKPNRQNRSSGCRPFLADKPVADQT